MWTVSVFLLKEKWQPSVLNFVRVIIIALLIFVGKGNRVPRDCHDCTYIELCCHFFNTCKCF